jgi:hypothetical protein
VRRSEEAELSCGRVGREMCEEEGKEIRNIIVVSGTDW